MIYSLSERESYGPATRRKVSKAWYFLRHFFPRLYGLINDMDGIIALVVVVVVVEESSFSVLNIAFEGL